MNATVAKMCFEAIASEFCTTVTMKNFDIGRMLILNKILKLNKSVEEVIFQFQCVKLGNMRIIINK